MIKINLLAEKKQPKPERAANLKLEMGGGQNFLLVGILAIGVVVAVSAFNHPLNLIAHQVGPAIAAGCPTIVKPAGDTPLSCLRFVQMLREAGLPEEWCQPVITANRDVATALVTDPRVAFFSFILKYARIFTLLVIVSCLS